MLKTPVYGRTLVKLVVIHKQPSWPFMESEPENAVGRNTSRYFALRARIRASKYVPYALFPVPLEINNLALARFRWHIPVPKLVPALSGRTLSKASPDKDHETLPAIQSTTHVPHFGAGRT